MCNMSAQRIDEHIWFSGLAGPYYNYIVFSMLNYDYSHHFMPLIRYIRLLSMSTTIKCVVLTPYLALLSDKCQTRRNNPLKECIHELTKVFAVRFRQCIQPWLQYWVPAQGCGLEINHSTTANGRRLKENVLVRYIRTNMRAHKQI